MTAITCNYPGDRLYYIQRITKGDGKQTGKSSGKVGDAILSKLLQEPTVGVIYLCDIYHIIQSLT